jgi:hypothetical protein
MSQETTLTTLETLIRAILGDYSKTMSPGDIFTYENSAVFTISEPNVNAVTDVLKNDVSLTSGQYSYDSSTNKVTISASLVSGDTIEVQYTYYPNYSSTEIQNYVSAALVHLSINNYYTFEVISGTVYPDPEPNEKNLIAFVTSVIINPDNKSYSLPDIRISVPKDLPLNEKINKIIAIAKRNSHGAFELL